MLIYYIMTLTEAAYWFKRFGVIIGVILGVVIITLLVVFYAPKQEAPPEYLSANCSCTDLKEDFLKEELQLESLELGSGSELVFQVETTTGQIDSLPKIINVYEFDNKGQSLSSQLQATEIANDLGFNPDGIIRKDANTYVWLDTARHRTLEIDARTLNFTLTTDSDYIRNISSKSSVPSNSEAATLATNVLRQANLLDEDYTKDNSLKDFTNIDINPDGTYSKAPSASDADLIRVDFKRRKSMISIRENIENAESIISSLERKMIDTDYIFTKDEEKVVYNDEKITLYNFSTLVLHQNPSQANITVYVGPENKDADNTEHIYRIEYSNWPIKEFPCGTYELISPSEAIQKIQDGEGSLAYLVPQATGDSVVGYQPKTIKKFIIYEITLAYYEPEEESTFLQPIYTVTGDAFLENDEKADFVYYVPAINYDLVTNKVVQETTEETTDENLLEL
jgi:hypothetical protein